MTVTKTGNYHLSPGADLNRDGYFRAQYMIGGASAVIHIYVADSKADKHVIGEYWPGKQPGTHTGLTISDEQFQPLFSKVGVDLATEFHQRGRNPIWLELQYNANELPDQYFSGNVGNREFSQAITMKVGGSVAYINSVYYVYVNHGPY